MKGERQNEIETGTGRDMAEWRKGGGEKDGDRDLRDLRRDKVKNRKEIQREEETVKDRHSFFTRNINLEM